MLRLVTVAVAALTVLFAAGPLAAAAPFCQAPEELAAMQFRQLQTELMVAALNCDGGAAGFDYGGTYATFVRNARPRLVQNARLLRAMFARAGMGTGAVDRYQTELSNNAQVESQSAQDYCGALAGMMAQAARLPPAELGAYAARTIPAPYGSQACAAPAQGAAALRNPS